MLRRHATTDPALQIATDHLAVDLYEAFGNTPYLLDKTPTNGVWQAWQRVAVHVMGFDAQEPDMSRERLAVLLHNEYKSFHKAELMQVPQNPIWTGWLKVADFVLALQQASDWRLKYLPRPQADPPIAAINVVSKP